MTESLETVNEEAVAQVLANEADPLAKFRELLRMTRAENPNNMVLLTLSEVTIATWTVGTNLEDKRQLVTEVVEYIDPLRAKYSPMFRNYH